MSGEAVVLVRCASNFKIIHQHIIHPHIYSSLETCSQFRPFISKNTTDGKSICICSSWLQYSLQLLTCTRQRWQLPTDQSEWQKCSRTHCPHCTPHRKYIPSWGSPTWKCTVSNLRPVSWSLKCPEGCLLSSDRAANSANERHTKDHTTNHTYPGIVTADPVLFSVYHDWNGNHIQIPCVYGVQVQGSWRTVRHVYSSTTITSGYVTVPRH